MYHALGLASVADCVIGWSKYKLEGYLTCTEFWLICSTLWVRVTGGNLHRFKKVTDSPLHSPSGRQMPAVRAVSGDCEIVHNRFGRFGPPLSQQTCTVWRNSRCMDTTDVIIWQPPSILFVMGWEIVLCSFYSALWWFLMWIPYYLFTYVPGLRCVSLAEDG